VDAILAGQYDPAELAKLRNWRIKADEETIRKSLVGNWRREHLFTLEQSRELYRTYQQQIVKCDQEIEKLVGGFEPRVDPEERPLPPDRKRYRGAKKRAKKIGRLEMGFNLRTEAYKIFGVDVTQIPGLETLALPLFGEVGRDMAKWPPPTTLPPGRGCARTMTLAEAGCCGRVHGNSTTGLGKCSGKPLFLCITVSPRWETTSAG
jgi:hypothetical protein